VPEVLEQRWAALRDDMEAGGIKNPRLAVTELQMFAHLGRGASSDVPRPITYDKLVSPPTHAEGLYDVLIYHAAVRLAPFVEMVTHSATVNHGGGLRKIHERVFANPCHYAQSMFAAFAETIPLKVELSCPETKAPLVLPELRNVTKAWTHKTLDVLAARASNGDLLLSIVQKGTEPVQLDVTLKDFEAGEQAQTQTLAADVPWAQNTLEAPKAIAPVTSTAQWSSDKQSLRLPPYSYTLVRIPHRMSR
jgi:alpha-N-arabinofuranosidase